MLNVIFRYFSIFANFALGHPVFPILGNIGIGKNEAAIEGPGSTSLGAPITCRKHKSPKQKWELLTEKLTLLIKDLSSNDSVLSRTTRFLKKNSKTCYKRL